MNNERVMPSHEYRDHTIVANAIPVGDGRFYSVFSVHKNSPGKNIFQLAVLHQEGHAAGMICASEKEATDQAAIRAREWIDAQ